MGAVVNLSRRPLESAAALSPDLSRCLSWVNLSLSRGMSRACRAGNQEQTRQTLRPLRAELSRRAARQSGNRRWSSKGSRPLRARDSRTVAR